MDDPATRFVLRQLPPFPRRLLSVVVAAAGISFVVTVLLAYLAITPSGSVVPNIHEVDRTVFGFRSRRPGLIERLLETADGPLNRGGSMRPAFTDQSVGWESRTEKMTAEDKAALVADREGERLAVLAWVRSGPSREAYEANDFRLDRTLAEHPITAAYLVADPQSADSDAQRRVRIQSILADRCVTCHSENGRDEHARWMPLETFEDIERKCHPEAVASARPIRLIASMVALALLALFTGPLFYLTNTTLETRRFLTVLPIAALIVTMSCWLLGREGTYAIYMLVGSAVVAAIGVMIQIVGSLAELLAKVRA